MKTCWENMMLCYYLGPSISDNLPSKYPEMGVPEENCCHRTKIDLPSYGCRVDHLFRYSNLILRFEIN